MFNSESKQCAKNQINLNQASVPAQVEPPNQGSEPPPSRTAIFCSVAATIALEKILEKLLEWAWPYFLQFLGWAWDWLVMHVHMHLDLHFMLGWVWWLVRILQTFV